MAVKRNLIANYLGQGWAALMGVAFIPLYIKHLGIEAYGLIGIFAMLQAWLTLLDLGMSPTLNREMARFKAGAHSSISIRDLLRSIEFIALAVALVLGLGIWAASDWLASNWLRVERLPVQVVAQAFAIMGVVTALRFVEGIYRSAIIGLQRQVLYNLINSALATLRGVGAAAILIWVTATIEVFFIWQGLVSLLTLGVLTKITYTTLPKADRVGLFSLSALRGIGKFAGGMIGVTFLALLLSQVDKILLSKLLPLAEYGYYTLAIVVSGTLYVLTGPITQAWFPYLSELYAANNHTELAIKFHQGAQLVSVLMGSAALVMIFFSETILQLWTQDTNLAHRSAYLLSILALGNLLNGLMWIPYQTQFAHGWTSLAIRVNIISVIFIIPAILWATPRYGAEATAWIWVCLNTGYVLVSAHFMFCKILTQEKWRWYRQDLLQPLLAAALLAGISAWAMPLTLSLPLQALWLLLASVMTLASSALAAPAVRVALLAQARLRLKNRLQTKT